MTTSNHLKDLQTQLDQLDEQIEEAKKRERKAFLTTVREGVERFGIPDWELLRAAGFLKPLPKKAPAKYYDATTGKSWSGRGACPKWLEGKNRDDYLIENNSRTVFGEDFFS